MQLSPDMDKQQQGVKPVPCCVLADNSEAALVWVWHEAKFRSVNRNEQGMYKPREQRWAFRKAILKGQEAGTVQLQQYLCTLESTPPLQKASVQLLPGFTNLLKPQLQG